MGERREQPAQGNPQRLFVGPHGHAVKGQPFDGFGPDEDFMGWMELASVLYELPHHPDSVHLGACGSMVVADVWSANKVAEQLPEMSLITYEANTIKVFIECALAQSLDDSGWDPFVFLDDELPRKKIASCSNLIEQYNTTLHAAALGPPSNQSRGPQATRTGQAADAARVTELPPLLASPSAALLTPHHSAESASRSTTGFCSTVLEHIRLSCCLVI
jgi:hypothetical protein